jgi:hypothetical protein
MGFPAHSLRAKRCSAVWMLMLPVHSLIYITADDRYVVFASNMVVNGERYPAPDGELPRALGLPFSLY